MATYRTDIATFDTTSGTKTATLTTAVGDWLIALVAHDGNLLDHAVTDNQSGTWERVYTGPGGTTADSYSVWIRRGLVTTAAATIVQTAPGASTGGGLNVIAVAGMTRGGRDGIRQFAFQNTTASTTPAPVFATAPLTDNMVIGFVSNGTNGNAVVHRTNFSERQDLGHNVPAAGLETMTRDSGETATTQTWGGASASAFSAIVLEIDASSAPAYYKPTPSFAHPPRRVGFGPPVLTQQTIWHIADENANINIPADVVAGSTTIDQPTIPIFPATVAATATVGASPTGTWVQRATLPVFGIYGIGYDSGKWTIATNSGGLYTSTDATADLGDWTSRTSQFSGSAIRQLAVGNGTWVIVGDSGKMSTATDPTSTWTARTSSFGATQITAVAYGNGVWVAAGATGKIATATDPTSTWTQGTSSFGSDQIFDVAYGNGVWVAVGASGKIATATDPTGTWTQVASPPFSGNSAGGVAYGAGVWVGVAASGKLATATDPTGTWTSRTSSFSTTDINKVRYGNGTWVAIGAAGKLATSITPTSTWTQQTSSFSGSEDIYSAFYANGVWLVSGGFTGKMATSAQHTAVGSVNINPGAASYGTNFMVAETVFNSGVAGWTATGGYTVTQDAVEGNNNVGAMKIVVASAGFVDFNVPITVPDSWSSGVPDYAVFSYYVKGNVGATANAYVYYADDATNLLMDVLSSVTISSSWQRASSYIDYGALNTANYQRRLRLRINMGAAAGTFYVDDIQLERNATTALASTWKVPTAVPCATTIDAPTVTTSTPDALVTGVTVAGTTTIPQPGITVPADTVNGVTTIAQANPSQFVATVAGTTTIPQANPSQFVATVSAVTTIPQANPSQFVDTVTAVTSIGTALVVITPATVAAVATIPQPDRTTSPATLRTVASVTAGQDSGQIAWHRTSTNDGTSASVRNFAAYGNGYWLTSNNSSTLLYSTDGVTWTSKVVAASYVQAVYGNGYWVAVGSSGAMATAVGDPTGTWTTRTSSFGATNILNVAYGNGVFVATGASGKLATATDPTGTWTQVAGTPFAAQSIGAVAYGNGYWVAGTTTSSSTSMMYATDPTSTWTVPTSPVSSDHTWFAYNDAAAMWVGAASSGSAGTQTATDPTGTWTRRLTTSVSFVAATTNGRLWVALGTATPNVSAYTASDPTGTWTQVQGAYNLRTTTSVSPQGLGCDGTSFVAAAQGTLLGTVATYDTNLVIPPSVVAGTTTIPQANPSQFVATVAGTTTIPQANPSQFVATVAAVTTIAQPTTLQYPATVSAVTTIAQPTTLQYPATVSAVTTIGQPVTPQSPNTVNGVGTVDAPTIHASSTIVATTVAAVASIDSPAVVVSTNATAAVETLAMEAVVGQYEFSDDFERADGAAGNGWTGDITGGEIGSTSGQTARRSYPKAVEGYARVEVGSPGSGGYNSELSFRTGSSEYDTGSLDVYFGWYTSGVLWISAEGFDESTYNDTPYEPVEGDIIEAETDGLTFVRLYLNGVFAVDVDLTVITVIDPGRARSVFAVRNTTNRGYVEELYFRTSAVPLTVTTETVVPVSTVAATATVGAPTIQVATDATVSAATVSAVATVGQPVTPQSPNTVNSTTTVDAPTIHASSTIAAATVNATTTITQPNLTFVTGVSTVDATTTIGAPTFVSSATVAAVTVAGTGTVGQPTTIRYVNTVSAVASVDAPTLHTSSTITPATVNAVATVDALTVQTSSTVVAATVAGTTSTGNDYVQPAQAATVSAVATVGAPSIQTSGNINISAATVSAVATVGSPTFTSDVSVLLSTVSALTSVGSPTFISSVAISPSAVAGTTSIDAPTIHASSTITASTVSAVATVGAPTVSGSALVPAAVVAASTSVGSPSVSAGSSSTPAPATVQATTTVGSPAETTSSTVTVSTVNATTTAPAPTETGGALVPASTVAGATTVPTPPAPAGGNTTIGTPVIIAGSTVDTVTVAAIITVGAPTPSAGAGSLPTTVSAQVTVGSPQLFAGSTVSTQTVGASTTIGTTQIANTALIFLAVVQAVASQDAVTVTTARTPFRGWGSPIR